MDLCRLCSRKEEQPLVGRQELLEWVESLSEDAEIAIDEGGLTLIEVEGEAYLEVGGSPEGH
jgi:hypothetical protein